MTGAFHLFGLGPAQFETLMLVLVRVSAMLSFVPIFSAQQVPLPLRFGLGFLLTFVIAQTVHVLAAPLDLGGLTAAIVSQVMIGATFGFISFLVFTGIQFAGAVIDLQIGFGVVNVINPTTQQQVTILGELELALATLIYLAVDAHHFLIEGIAGSFNLVPLPFVALQPGFDADIVGFFSRVLYLVFQIAGPIAIALFVTNCGLALMARVAPQMNIFAIGFPLQILVGLTMVIVTMPLLGVVLPGVFQETPRELDAVLRHLRPAGP